MPSFLKKIDWFLVLPIIPLVIMSLSALYSFSSLGEDFFLRQMLWFIISFSLFFVFSQVDFSFFKKTSHVILFYGFSLLLLVFVLFFGVKINGARSWIHIAGFSFQPADLTKVAFAVLLSKYLAKRHIILKSFKYVFFTFLYFALPFFLIFLQPDFGSALILLIIWFGIVLFSGLSKKHFFLFLVTGIIASLFLWTFVFHDYQKKRVLTFLHPLSDVRGAGYNAYQSTIAVGSGRIVGKGVGYGTQSRLAFLPEHETDFIFAAITEEWGFIGTFTILLSFLFLLLRLVSYVEYSHGNFERLFTLGFIFYLLAHIIINIGMNIGLMPVTGVPLPFVSYGGSHLLVEFLFLAIILSFRSHTRTHSIYKREYADAFLH